jgi:hypothetical protein
LRQRGVNESGTVCVTGVNPSKYRTAKVAKNAKNFAFLSNWLGVLCGLGGEAFRQQAHNVH